MDADWSVEAAAEDPVVVVPWPGEPASASPSKAQVSGFVDLRGDPGNKAENANDVAAVDRLPEAVEHPALRQALLRLNDPNGCLRTAKCDVWEIDREEMESLQTRFDLAPARYGRGSYVDVLLAEGFAEAGLPAHEDWTRAMVRAAGEMDEVGESASCAEFIVRPAHVDRAWGYAVTVYVWSVGNDAPSAEEHWTAALGEVVRAVIQTAPRQHRDTMCATGE
ncbi:MAG: hypothetical protein ACR2JE_13225 [Acidobacteriaceae bacterium]